MPFQFPNEEKTRIIIACVPPKFVLAECGTTNFYTTMTQPLRFIVEALLYFLRVLFLFTFSSVRCDDFASECMVRVKEKKTVTASIGNGGSKNGVGINLVLFIHMHWKCRMPKTYTCVAIESVNGAKNCWRLKVWDWPTQIIRFTLKPRHFTGYAINIRWMGCDGSGGNGGQNNGWRQNNNTHIPWE